MKLKSRLIAVLIAFGVIYGLPVEAKQDKKQTATVMGGNNTRFTVLTDGTIRMEWSPTAHFVDDRSFVAIHRNLPVPDYTTKDGSWLTIQTSKMVLKYKKNSGRFTADNLIITAAKGARPFTWKPGTKPTGNLKGTYRTFDGYDGETNLDTGKKMPIEDGLISTDGWTLIDDSRNFLLDNSDWPWVEERTEKNEQDWYFMAYGHDYKAALKDFTIFAGKIPIPPRYAFGYWWSRYRNYSDKEFRDLVAHFDAFNIPLDLLVVDMDWHYTEKGKGGWTGWTWNRELFPEPTKFLSWANNERGLKTTLNLHPADGVAPYEEKYSAMAQWMGIDSTTHVTIPWVASDKHFITGIFKNILHPMQDQGVDFWWLDWQQTPYDSKIDSLSNTWWLNYVFFTDMERSRNTRPMLYHRWGGLGNHRYEIGFSGDALISWQGLAFQPYFTTCASNVLYGYWSHDLGGHTFGNDRTRQVDPELYTRWMQYGCLSPIMRTHSSSAPNINKEIWLFKGDYFTALRNSILLRRQLVPYIYTMAREAYDTGVSLCRPLYYDYPEAKEAYEKEYRSEYMFGDNILVSPIISPMENGQSKVNVWLPNGSDWYEWQTGTLLKGGQTVERSFSITEYPIYVKAGSVLPLYDNPKSLESNDDAVTLAVFPGGNGSFDMYEDNGDDNVKEYATNFATTKITSERTGQNLKITLAPRKGSYKGMPNERQLTIKVYGSAIPKSVDVNGTKAEYKYSSDELALLVTLPKNNCTTQTVLNIQYPTNVPELNDGLVRKFKSLTKTMEEVRHRRDEMSVLIPALGYAEETSIAISYHPERFDELIEQFRTTYDNIPQILKDNKLTQKDCDWFMNELNH